MPTTLPGDAYPDRILNSAVADRVRWAMSLSRDLHDIPPQSNRRPHAFLHAAVQHFAASAALLTIFRITADGHVEHVHETSLGWETASRLSAARDRLAPVIAAPAPTEQTIEQIRQVSTARAVPGPAHASAADDSRLRAELHSLGVDDFIKSTIALEDDQYASIDLFRSSAQPTFEDDDAAWLTLIHQQLKWIYALSTPAGRPELQGLTPRERETLKYLLAGASEKEVAHRLGRSKHTVHSSVKRIYRQLNVSSRAELLSIFLDARQHDSTLASEVASATRDRKIDETIERLSHPHA